MIVIDHSPEKNAKHHIWTRPVDWRNGLNTGSLIIREKGIETTGRSDTNSQRFLNPKARVHERFPSEFTSQVEWSCLITPFTCVYSLQQYSSCMFLVVQYSKLCSSGSFIVCRFKAFLEKNRSQQGWKGQRVGNLVNIPKIWLYPWDGNHIMGKSMMNYGNKSTQFSDKPIIFISSSCGKCCSENHLYMNRKKLTCSGREAHIWQVKTLASVP
jgi:hypothetical protein